MTHDDIWTIIGSGMGGKGLAAELGLAGCRIRMHDRAETVIGPIRRAGGLHVEGRTGAFAPVELATTDLGSAVRGASIVIVCVNGNEQTEVARELAPLLVDGQVIVLVQGHFAGALLMRAELARAGCRRHIDVAEMDAYPYMHTILAPDRVLLATTKGRWQLASMPASRGQAVLERIGFAFPGMVGAASLLDTAFVDMGGIFHVAGMITNVGRVEDSSTYGFYAANMVPSVCNLVARLDEERVAVAAAYGVETADALTWLKATYGVPGANLYEALQAMAVTHYRFAPAPKTLDHRYLVQDVGCALVPLVAFGTLAGIPVPTSTAAVGIADALTGGDFARDGRSLANLGLEGLGADQVKALITA